MKNTFKIFLSLALAFVCMAFVACGGGDGGDGGDQNGAKTYTLEAEYINLTGLESATASGTIGELELVYGDGTNAHKNKGWSNGYYVGPTHKTGFKMDFVFTADKEGVATIKLRLGSEILGTIALTSANFKVELNGTAISYGSLSLTGVENKIDMTFSDKQIATNAQLVAGVNTLSLTVLENTLRGGETGGPMVDCVKIITESTLTWDVVDNPANRGQA